MRRRFPLLDLDPDLGALVREEVRDACRRELDVEVHRLPQGPWGAGGEHADAEHAGLLMVDGVIARDVVVSDTVSTELLGPGDVVRPWSLQASPGLLRSTIRWTALTDVRVGVLDRWFAGRLARWPEVNVALLDRLNERTHRLATTQAISQLNRVDRRLLSLFWHLAERWGRMTPEGVAIPLTLSHRMLGQLVGARRPTVSSAIGELASRDELVRRDDGTWLLKGDPVGTPTGEAERQIPIRRRLLGRLPDEKLGLETPSP
jgi:CRP/FNR family transcriptional regulator, cyclic AMP receptor protein